MGAGGLEPPEAEAGGFTVPCNCHYATPPLRWGKICWRKELNPQPSDYKSGALPIELRQHRNALILAKKKHCAQLFDESSSSFLGSSLESSGSGFLGVSAKRL